VGLALCFVPGFIFWLSPLWNQRRLAYHDQWTKTIVVPK
jgi:hypothetical protein